MNAQLLDANTRRMMFYSDVEHRDWLGRAVRVLEEESNIPAVNVVSIYQAARLACSQLAVQMPEPVLASIEASLLAAAGRGDRSAVGAGVRMFERGDEFQRLLAMYDGALVATEHSALQMNLLEAIQACDANRISTLVRADPRKVLEVLLAPVLLEEIHYWRAKDRVFYFGTLLSVVEWARACNCLDVLSQFWVYVAVCVCCEDVDASDLHRFNQLPEVR